MNGQEVQRVLLDGFQAQPMPAGQVSSYWRQYAGSLDRTGFESPYACGTARRMLSALERVSYRQVTRQLAGFPRAWATALDVFADMTRRDPAAPPGAGPNFNVLKAACVASVLLDHWDRHAWPATIAIIGDGYGMLGALLSRLAPKTRVYAIDLPAGLVAQASSYCAANPEETSWSVDPSQSGRFTFVRADQIESVTTSIDCAVNVASMQEMDRAGIARYFTLLRERSHGGSHFYCVNRVEKTLPDGAVIRFDQFPWRADDTVFIDGPCPFYTHYLAARPRFLRPFDGSHWHRLAHLVPIVPGERA